MIHSIHEKMSKTSVLEFLKEAIEFLDSLNQ